MSEKKWYEVEDGDSTWTALGKLVSVLGLWLIILLLRAVAILLIWNTAFSVSLHYTMDYTTALWISLLVSVLK